MSDLSQDIQSANAEGEIVSQSDKSAWIKPNVQKIDIESAELGGSL